MIYLLDSNACIRYLNKSNSGVVNKIASLPTAGIRLCSVVKFELLYGAQKSQQRTSNLALLKNFFAHFVSLPFDDKAAHIAAIERARLEAIKQPIGALDLLIAAIAIANNLTLVTHNTREFSRVANLQFEDWEL